MSSLQIGLIAAGVLLVVGVLVYNALQERRFRHSVENTDAGHRMVAEPDSDARVEPTLFSADAARAAASDAAASLHAADGRDATPFELPVDVIEAPGALAGAEAGRASHAGAGPEAGAAPAAATGTRAAPASPGPDHEIECIIALQPAEPVSAGALAAGLHARLGKPLRWFGRSDRRSDWRQLASDTPGRHSDVIACMLLADRNGAASPAQIEAFSRVVGDIAPTLPAAFVPPDVSREAARAEALDRLCADLDVQIGLTVRKPESGAIPGTRLRGVAEAAGFHLAPAGRFEFAAEDGGTVLYSLQNLRPDPFTPDSLRLTATDGVVFLLDVARVADPARVFDQMKNAARRMAATLGGELVDDNKRPLDDAALGLIRDQVEAAAEALQSVHIDPGSARALALFGA